ncbi:helix-turn-helix transcriptional regulator [Nodosilinea sp. E11]|uniref:helix-turn-helix transcriptional regulator n=1 Tax=Nodosilinea sp. E11 TaxID=3037479 RepID=UPI002934F420|nr:sigma factor-like helix-turn-helix DNA-binding protein [Nodosilinea sp. E11]WOD38571.1 LuxR C-terminal-related transcriptional regulator [Nodosilinea sp. E11]
MSSSSTLSQTSAVAPTQEIANLPLLSAVLEGFVDGILVLSNDGTCVHSNQKGRALCRDLGESDRPDALPACLKTMSQHLQESREFYPEVLLVLTQEVTSRSGHQIRVRIQWLDLPTTPDTYLLVSLENKTRSAHSSALLEAVQYNLTPRERAVWMLRRANRTYDEIAKELYITVNTVKRHLKSIYAKRKEVSEPLVN